MRPFLVESPRPADGNPTILRVTPTEVLMTVDGMSELDGACYLPRQQVITVSGHVEATDISSLEQAIAWYALRLHGLGRLKGRPMGYILPCISISYGTGYISKESGEKDWAQIVAELESI